MPLSSRQQAIIDYIRLYVRSNGYPPSVREIGLAVGLASSSTVHGHLERLQTKGYLRRDATKPRAIELYHLDDVKKESSVQNNTTTEYPDVVMVPLIGKVTAGIPISAYEDVADYLPLPKNLTKDDEVFLLRVQGDSMIEAGILDGDCIIVRRQESAENGDIVVAMTEEDEATVKRYFREKEHIRLQPENSSMAPILVKHVTILGLVIGVYRTYH